MKQWSELLEVGVWGKGGSAVGGPGVTGMRLSGGAVRWGLVVRDSGCSCSEDGELRPLWEECVCSVCVAAGAAGDASAVVGVAGESSEEAGLAWDRWVCVR